MNAPLKLSIITTSLNRVLLLKKTLESVLAQTYPSIEQVVVDAGSHDGTREVLQQFEARFKEKGFGYTWISEKDSGQGEGMNKGLRMATGEFVMILNSDDFLVDDRAVREYMEVLEKNLEVDLLYGNHENLYEDGRRTLITHHLYSMNAMVNKGYQIPQSAAILRRSLVLQAGGFDQALHHVAEHDLFLRMLRAGAQSMYFPRTLQVTLEHAGRKTNTNTARAWRETKMVNRRNGGSFFSKFELVYIKNVYAGGFFSFLERHTPGLYQGIKRVFTILTK
jgi:glycosyltransferase involved in cell wall biosynthesis